MISLTILISLNGCAVQNRPVFQIPQIEVPAKPEVPPIKFERIEGRLCVNTENAQKLFLRDRILKQDGEELRSLINSINREFGIRE